MRLLLHRFGDAACDFSAEPKNVEFRQQLEAKGITLAPWLSDSFELLATTGGGEPYRVAFTRDIVDYLMMGLHFDTCLSPGSCNFFSTIANAVDINKQVVYGKTNSGRVIGRCLFTLTDQGTILTYYRYTHDPADAFDAAVEQFAERLAQAMNTRLASSGKVPTLVAHDWYDDGAVRRESMLDLQSADGVVRQLLRRTEPDVVIDELNRVLGADDAVRSVLSSLLFVDEFTRRPAIVAPFVNAYGFDAGVAFKERFRLAILARGAGLHESARAIVLALRPNTLPARLKRDHCTGCCAFHGIGSYQEVFDVLTDHSPTLALRAVRATRPGKLTQDTDEVDRDRIRPWPEFTSCSAAISWAEQLAASAEHNSQPSPFFVAIRGPYRDGAALSSVFHFLRASPARRGSRDRGHEEHVGSNPRVLRSLWRSRRRWPPCRAFSFPLLPPTRESLSARESPRKTRQAIHHVDLFNQGEGSSGGPHRSEKPHPPPP